tara:strand:- start:290 stop:454 length:165 start_codon:yes stop_codon:yes gene_type:complete
MKKLVQILVERDSYSKEDAIQEVEEMKERVLHGENPEEILYEIGLEPDYIFELL